MKGFQIIINNETVINLKSFFSNIILTKVDDNYLLLMYGGDEQKYKFEWESKVLNVGDLINIKVLDLKSGTLPKKTSVEDISSIKEAYEYLKIELENNGII